MKRKYILVVDPPGYVLDSRAGTWMKVLTVYTMDWWSFARLLTLPAAGAYFSASPSSRHSRRFSAGIRKRDSQRRTRSARKDAIRNRPAVLYDDVKRLDQFTRHAFQLADHEGFGLVIPRYFEFQRLTRCGSEVWPVGSAITSAGPDAISGDKPLLITEFGANTIRSR